MSSTSADNPPAPTEPPPPDTARTLSWWAFGLANVVIVLVVSILLWWLLIDPRWSPLGSYPQPYNASLFWAIIATVWVAFNCGWTGPARLRQPARGLVGLLVPLAIAAVIVVLLAFAWGRIDPSFAASRPEGAGFGTGQLVVLFAFFFYVTAVINWNQWPWAGRLAQPWTGVAEIATLVLPTLLFFGVFAVPILTTWGDPAVALMSKETVTGWFYSCIVAVVITGLIWDNMPWAAARTPARTAVFSLVGNFVLGTLIFFGATELATLLMGPANAAALGDGITAYAAEFGVCWVFWMIAWSNVFGNRPTHLARAANAAIRTVVTLVLAIGTFLVYYFVVAGAVLHEPAVGASLHGDALGFMNFAVLITLFYVLFLESYGLPRAEPDAAAADAETVAVETATGPRT